MPKTIVLKTHTMCALNMHALSEYCVHMQQYCTAVAGVLHCTRLFSLSSLTKAEPECGVLFKLRR